MVFDYPTLLDGQDEPRSIHVLLMHEQNGSKVAAIVDLRNRDRVTGTPLLKRLRSLRKVVLGMGYDRVYTFSVCKRRCKYE